jgi:hypothetical protein
VVAVAERVRLDRLEALAQEVVLEFHLLLTALQQLVLVAVAVQNVLVLAGTLALVALVVEALVMEVDLLQQLQEQQTQEVAVALVLDTLTLELVVLVALALFSFATLALKEELAAQ